VFLFEASPAVTCIVAIGIAWLAGVTMQLVAGSVGRVLHWAVRDEAPRVVAAHRVAADRS